MADQVNRPAAVLFYTLFIAGMVFFVTGATVRSGALRQALVRADPPSCLSESAWAALQILMYNIINNDYLLG